MAQGIGICDTWLFFFFAILILSCHILQKICPGTSLSLQQMNSILLYGMTLRTAGIHKITDHVLSMINNQHREGYSWSRKTCQSIVKLPARCFIFDSCMVLTVVGGIVAGKITVI